MQRYRIVIMLVLFGVLPVVAAFFFALSYLEEREVESTQAEVAPVVEEAAPEPPETQNVLAAARALPVGTLLGKGDLTTLALDPAAIDEEHIVVTGDGPTGVLRGYAVREAIAEGAPITTPTVVEPGQRGFLAAVLRPGARAVTIQVGQATSHAALIDLGDRVDVILSAELTVDGGDRRRFARTIVEDVRVVAIDRRVGSDPDSRLRGEDGVIAPRQMVTATLEASLTQGDRLVLGQHEGTLSLAVRSLAATQTPDKAVMGEAVDLREMLLSSSEFSASQARLRRTQELNDLSIRTQIVESTKGLRAAMEDAANPPETVRVFRGSEPAAEVVFKP